MPKATSPDATVEKILYFDGQPTTYLVRPIPTVCCTTADRSVRDEDGCGGTANNYKTRPGAEKSAGEHAGEHQGIEVRWITRPVGA